MNLKLLIIAAISLFFYGAYAQVNIQQGRTIGGRDNDYANKSVKDGDYIYVIGTSSANDFPSTDSSTFVGGFDFTISKINTLTGNVVFSRIIGGTSDEYVSDIQVVGNNVHIIGYTQSSNFPVTNGSSLSGTYDIFYTKLNATTGATIFSSYYGGNNDEQSPSLFVEGNNVHIRGNTNSTNFPVTNSSTLSGSYDVFYLQINHNTGAINTATYLGGAGWDFGNIIKVEAGVVYLPFNTSSNNLPVTDGSFYVDLGTLFVAQNVAYFKISASTGNILFGTYVAGANSDLGGFTELKDFTIENGKVHILMYIEDDLGPVSTNGSQYIQNNNNSYYVNYDLNTNARLLASYYQAGFYKFQVVNNEVNMVGFTSNPNIPVTNGSTYKGQTDVVYYKIDAANGNILTGTYLGGTDYDLVYNLQVVGSEVNIKGISSSIDYPVTNNSINNQTGSNYNIIYTKINSNTGNILLSTYIGGSDEVAGDIFMDGNFAYLLSTTNSNNFPVTFSGNINSGTQGDLSYIKLRLCNKRYEISNDKLTPSNQSVCQNGYADPIIGKRIFLTGDSMPLIYRNNSPLQQTEQEAKYQWQSAGSPTGPWLNISAAIEPNYLPKVGTVSQYYRRLSFNSTYCNDILSISNVDTILVNGFTAPVLSGGGLFNTCPATAVTIGGSPTATGGVAPYTYAWIAGNNPTIVSSIANPSVSPSLSTIYTLEVRDANLCRNLTQAIVTTFQAQAGPNVSACNGDSVRLKSTQLQGLSGTVYAWTPSGGLGCTSCAQPRALVAALTTYTFSQTINITGGGTCTTTDDVNVTPIAAPITANIAGPDRVICFGTTANLGTAPEAGFTYTWAPGNYLSTNSSAQTIYNPGTLQFPPIPDSAVYYLTASRGGCSFSDAVTVSVIRADAGLDGCGPRMIGGNSDVATLNETFSWIRLSGGGSFIGATNVPNTSVSASPTGNPTTYRLTTTYRGATCTDDVYVPDCLCGVIIEIGSPNGCASVKLGGPVNLTANSLNGSNSDFDYAWTVVTGPAGGLNNYNNRIVTLTDTFTRTYRVTITNKFDPTWTCSQTVLVNQPNMTLPVFNAKDTLICPSQPVNIGQALVVGYSYLWSPALGLNFTNISNPQATVAKTQRYEVLVTDVGTGCYTKDTANILVQNVVANAGPDWTICNPSIIARLGAEPARPHHKYIWAPNNSNWQILTDSSFAQPYVLVAVNTTFTLTATDTLTGCFVTDQVNVVIDNAPNIPNSPDIVMCRGVQDTIGNVALPGVTYSWTPTIGLSSSTVAMPIVNPTVTTTYIETVTFPGGCTSLDTIVVTVNDPSFSLSNINYCPSSGAVALGAGAPAGMVSYTWSPSSWVSTPFTQTTNTLSPPPAVATTYSLRIRDNNGCFATATTTITPSLISPIAGNNKTICLSDVSTTIGNASNPTGGSVTYAWTGTGISGLNSTTNPNPTFTPTAAGTYTFTLTNTDASIPCSNTSTVTVIVNDFQLPILSQPTLCLGASVQIGTSSTVGASYFWTPTVGLSDSTISNPIANPTVSRTYNLLSIGANGCRANGTVAVTVTNTPAPTITIPIITSCLANLKDTFRPIVAPVAAYNYDWTPNDGSLSSTSVKNPQVIFTGVGTKTYTLTVTNTATGCLNTATGIVVVNNNCPIPLKGSLGNFVWLDLNKDGVQGAGETGVAGVTIDLFKNGPDNLPGTADDILVGSTKTDAYGFYKFDKLDASNYNLKITPPLNYNFTTQSNTADSTAGSASAVAGSDFSATNSRTYSINLYAGENEPKIDAGLIFEETLTASIGDKVWFDENNNGVQDATESGLAGVTVTLYNSAGNPVATTITDAQGYYLFDNLTPADYRLGVTLPMSTKFSPSNVGNDDLDSDLDPSTGRTGLYTLAANQAIRSVDIGITPIASTKASLGDKMWYDVDQDGVQDASEIGAPNVRVRLFDDYSNLIATTTTDAFGNYMFTDLDAGFYRVNFDLPTGYVFTTKNNASDSFADSDPNTTTGISDKITLKAGDRFITIDAGIYQSAPTGTASLGDKVWFDKNADGIQDSDEGGVAGITVTLYNSSNVAIATTSTDINGNYNFIYLAAGDYSVGFSNIPKEYSITNQTNGTADGSDANPATGRTPQITLSAGQNFTDLDLGLVKGTDVGLAALGNFVWNDVNQNGLQDAGEFGVSGVQVSLNIDLNGDGDCNDAGEQNFATTITDGSGYYSFPSLAAGTYQVVFTTSTIPTGFVATTANSGGNDNIDSDGVLTGVNYVSSVVSLAKGENNTSLDFGIYVSDPTLGSIGNYVWIDTNGDGVQDATESGLPGVQVTLYDVAGNVLKVMTTDANGGYLFDGLPAGNYTVGISNIPSGFTNSPARTTSSGLDSDIDPLTKRSNVIILSSGQDNMTIDAGVVPTKAALGNYVWRDSDGDGVQDAGEPGISGVTVILYDATNNPVASTITDANGFYLFPNLDPGTYTVGFSTIPAGLLWTIRDANTGTDLTDNDVNPLTGRTSPITLLAGDVNLSVDAGLRPAILELGNYVWLDVNNDGNQGATEKGVPGMVVKLYSVGGNGTKGGSDDVLMGTTITNGSGYYLFTNVPAGSYYVEFSNPITGYPFTTKDNVADALDSDVDPSTGQTDVFAMTNANNYTIDAGIVGSLVALPLKYEFKAKKVNQTAFLEWEVFNNHSSILNYQVYRSANGFNYELIGSVIHTGNNKHIFLDKNPHEGANYYKINIISEDGNLMTYSRVLMFNNVESNTIVAYPNPTNGLVNIETTGLVGETVNILVFDVQGKEIVNQTYSNFVGFETINLKDFAKGVYQIKVITEYNQYSQKIILID